MPPVWFLAVEELLQGHATPYFERLATIAAAVFAAASLAASVTYAVLYRRFDRVMMRPAAGVWGIPMACAPPRADAATALERRGHP